MANVWDYLNDHAAAGHCAYSHYHGTHNPSTCPATAGVCEVIRYLVGELKIAEARKVLTEQPAPANIAPFDPLRDTPAGGWQLPPETRG